MKAPTGRVEPAILDGTLITLILSDRAAGPHTKVVARPVVVQKRPQIQFEYHEEKKVTHRNLGPKEAATHVKALLGTSFRQAQVFTADADIHITIDARGRATEKVGPATRTAADPSHDRKKGHLLADGTPHDFLVRLGVMSAAGKVHAPKYAKFRQINRFLEMVADVAGSLDKGRPVRVVDFGCGKSYLTFALYHYLNTILGLDAHLTGLDLKEDVVRDCAQIARDLGYSKLEFRIGDIAGHEAQHAVDMVVMLHACDTATDDGLVKAVAWGAKVILAVPCCQHELRDAIEAAALGPMLKHGIVRERLTEIVTDSLRAAALGAVGYPAQIVEFIETEHTPKNLMIRAVKSGAPGKIEPYVQLRDFWKVRPSIDRLVKEVPRA